MAHRCARFWMGRRPRIGGEAAFFESDFREVEGESTKAQFGFGPISAICVLRDERYKYVHCAGLPKPLLFDLSLIPESWSTAPRTRIICASVWPMRNRLLTLRARAISTRRLPFQW